MLHGVKNMIGSTMMLMLMRLFATFVCELSTRKFLASKKREPTFTKNGLTYWKEATTAFNQYQLSAAHLEAIESLMLLPSQIQGDIGEILSHEHEEEKRINRKMFLLILEVIRFLVQQGLPMRGNDNDTEGNFIQLLSLHGKHCAPQNINHWISKKTNKYTSHEIQNGYKTLITG